MGSNLQQAAHSDAHRLTGPIPKMILITYKDDAHPSPATPRPGPCPGRGVASFGRCRDCHLLRWLSASPGHRGWSSGPASSQSE